MTEVLKNTMAAVHSTVLTLSVLVAGLWAYHNYDPLMHRPQRSVNVNIKASQLEIPGDAGRYVCATVEFENVGKDPEVFHWPQPPEAVFRATRISIGEDGKLVTGAAAGIRIERSPGFDLGARLLPGQVGRRVFLAKVDKPGLYYLEFWAAASGLEQHDAYGRRDINTGEEVSWQDATYLIVK